MTETTPSVSPSPDHTRIVSSQEYQLYRLRSFKRYKEQQPNPDPENSPDAAAQAARIIAQCNAALRIFGLPEAAPSPNASLSDQLEEESSKLLREISQNFDQEEVDRLTRESKERLMSYMRKRRAIEIQLSQLKDAHTKLIAEGLQKPGNQALQHIELVSSLDSTIQHLEGYLATSEIPYLDPESFLAHNLIKIKAMSRDLHESGIVQTDEVGRTIREIKKHIAAKGYAALLGETGTGKTEVAKQIAREIYFETHPEARLRDKEYNEEPFFLIPGSKQTSKEDLVRYLGVVPTYTDPIDIPKMINDAKEKYHAQCSIKGIDPSNTDWMAIQATLLDQAGQSQLKTEYVKSEVLRALEEGKVVIIDEFNFIDPAVLGSIYDIMNQMKKNPGAGIIFTGNMTQANFDRYKRNQPDSAFLDRLGQAYIEHRTPPMQDLNENTPPIKDRSELTVPSQVNQGSELVIPPKQDLFQIAMAHLVDKKGNLYGPSNVINEAWKLSKIFKVLQDNFAGKPLSGANGQLGGVPFQLEKVHASMRKFGEILRTWKAEGYQNRLDYYLYEHLIKPAIVLDAKEAAYIQNIATIHGFYITEDNLDNPWQDRFMIDSTTSQLSVTKPITPEEMHLKNPEFRLFSTQEVCEAFSGIKMPTKITEFGKEEILTEQERAEVFAEVAPTLESMETVLDDLENSIALYCADAAVVYS